MIANVDAVKLLNVKQIKTKTGTEYSIAEFGDERDFTKISVFVPERIIKEEVLEVGIHYNILINIELMGFRNNITLEDLFVLED